MVLTIRDEIISQGKNSQTEVTLHIDPNLSKMYLNCLVYVSSHMLLFLWSLDPKQATTSSRLSLQDSSKNINE